MFRFEFADKNIFRHKVRNFSTEIVNDFLNYNWQKRKKLSSGQTNISETFHRYSVNKILFRVTFKIAIKPFSFPGKMKHHNQRPKDGRRNKNRK